MDGMENGMENAKKNWKRLKTTVGQFGFPEYIKDEHPFIVEVSFWQTIVFFISLTAITVFFALDLLANRPLVVVSKDSRGDLFNTLSGKVADYGWLEEPTFEEYMCAIGSISEGDCKAFGHEDKLVKTGGPRESFKCFCDNPTVSTNTTLVDSTLGRFQMDDLCGTFDAKRVSNSVQSVCLGGEGECQLEFKTVKSYPASYKTNAEGKDELPVDKFSKRFKYDIPLPEDYKTNEEFCDGTEVESRTISIQGLCESSARLINANMRAYTEQLLFSSELLDQETVEEILRTRFEHTQRLSVTTFQLSFEMDTFRMEFEGVESNWGKQVNTYLDQIFAKDVAAQLKAYTAHVTKDYIEQVFLALPDDPFEAYIWDSVDFFWFPSVVESPLSLLAESLDELIPALCWDDAYHINPEVCCTTGPLEYTPNWKYDGYATCWEANEDYFRTTASNHLQSDDPMIRLHGFGYYDESTCCPHVHTSKGTPSDSGRPHGTDNGGAPTDDVLMQTEFPTAYPTPVDPESESLGDTSETTTFPTAYPTSVDPESESLGDTSETTTFPTAYPTPADPESESPGDTGIETTGFPTAYPTALIQNRRMNDATTAFPTYQLTYQPTYQPTNNVNDETGSDTTAFPTYQSMDDTEATTAFPTYQSMDDTGATTAFPTYQSMDDDTGATTAFPTYQSLDSDSDAETNSEASEMPENYPSYPTWTKVEEWRTLLGPGIVMSGQQIADFTASILSMQAYCLEKGLQMKPLYDDDRDPFPTETIRFWIEDLVQLWLDGNIDLEVPENEYGQSIRTCSRIPSVVNYVTECDCEADPLCESSTVDRFTYYFSMEKIVKETIKAPVTISCRSFRQLEIFQDEGIQFRLTALARKDPCCLKSSGMNDEKCGDTARCTEHCNKCKAFLQNQCEEGELLYDITRENFCDRAKGVPVENKQCDDGSGTNDKDCCDLCEQCGNDVSDVVDGINVFCTNEVNVDEVNGTLIQDVYCKNYNAEWISCPELGAVDVGTTFECGKLGGHQVDFEKLVSNAFVKEGSWDDGVFGAFGPDGIKRREEWPADLRDNFTYYEYYNQCQPRNCYYEEQAAEGLFLTLLLGLVGGLVPFLTVIIKGFGFTLSYLAGNTFEQRLKKGER